MFIKYKKALILLSLVFVFLTGCGNNQQEVPAIVFMCDMDFSRIASEGDPVEYVVTFVDKNGNQYISTDSSIYEMRSERLVAEYAEGNLEGKLELRNTCDVNTLMEKYKMLQKVASNKKYEIIEPDDMELLPDVESEVINWYGLLYDKDGTLNRIHLHCVDRTRHNYSNDDRANEIYEWYVEAF